MIKFTLSLLFFLSIFITTISCQRSLDSSDESCEDGRDNSDSSNSGENRNNNNNGRYSCPRDWRQFNRVRSPWCIKVFPAQGNVDRWTAGEYCRREGAVLTGIENSRERRFVQEQGVSVLQSQGSSSGSLWLGGQRRNVCLGTYKSAAECLPAANNAFEWTDGHTTGKDGFNWAPSQPDYHGETDIHVLMHLIGGPPSGTMNDVTTSAFYNSAATYEDIKAFACGKVASRR